MTDTSRVTADSGQSVAACSDMEAEFERAAQRCGVHETWYRLAGRLVRLRVVGERLANQISRPLGHLRVDDAPAEESQLSIDLWDEVEADTPRPVRYLRDCFARTWRYGGGALACSGDEEVVGYQTPQACTVYHRSRKSMVGSVPQRSNLSSYELGKPLQPLLFAWHTDSDVTLVHAGFVAQGDAGVLLGGAGGSGKTTVSLTCLHASWSYLGDDYIGVGPPTGGQFRGSSIYNSTWLDPGHACRFDWLSGHEIVGTHPIDEKHLFLLSDVYPDRCRESAAVAALALPRVVGSGSSGVRTASKAEALLRLAPSSILQLPFVPGASSLGRMTEVVESVPAFWLDIGSDLGEVPDCVDEILARATR